MNGLRRNDAEERTNAGIKKPSLFQIDFSVKKCAKKQFFIQVFTHRNCTFAILSIESKKTIFCS
jgi:hypothetical protein